MPKPQITSNAAPTNESLTTATSIGAGVARVMSEKGKDTGIPSRADGVLNMWKASIDPGAKQG